MQILHHQALLQFRAAMTLQLAYRYEGCMQNIMNTKQKINPTQQTETMRIPSLAYDFTIAKIFRLGPPCRPLLSPNTNQSNKQK